ncbi:MAG TPA: alpha-L-fucosidase [Phycisphaerae bacterium]|nr:alpha-L-fucosidase [Phycisphaerae bacterium]
MRSPRCQLPFARLVLVSLSAGILAASLAGCQAAKPLPPTATRPYLEASAADMQWFRQAKFGLFIHWGPVSIKGTEIGWSRSAERPGRQGKGEVPVEIYDNLYKQFNPTGFNADEWVATAKAAGVKYLVFTSKHHDGFCMFDTKLSDYKITNSPFKRDICAELADACHRAGLKLGWYYSQPDWHHPDYRTENHARYLQYMHGQVRELLTNYGKVDIMWFDGLGGSAEDWDADNLFRMIRSQQPGILINNRAGLPADYDTPEQKIGQAEGGRPWETCMTIGEQWAYKPNDYVKSLKECLHVLIKVVGGDGNLLFNVGPRPDGRIEPEQVDRLKAMGQWLQTNGRTIFGTRGGPFIRDYWGTSTHRDRTVYLHVLGWDEGRVRLAPVPRKILSAALQDGSPVEFKQTAGHITLIVPPQRQDPIDTIVTLQLDRSAGGLKLPALPSGSLAKGRKASEADTGQKEKDNPTANAFDDDYTTIWQAFMRQPPARLEVDLGSDTKIDRARLCEILDRTREFVIECRGSDQEEWKPLARGTTIGQSRLVRFEPTVTRHIRLGILKIDGNRPAQLAEFQIFAPVQ